MSSALSPSESRIELLIFGAHLVERRPNLGTAAQQMREIAEIQGPSLRDGGLQVVDVDDLTEENIAEVLASWRSRVITWLVELGKIEQAEALGRALGQVRVGASSKASL